MKDYTLSKEKIAALEKFHRSLRDKRQADRVKAVIDLFSKIEAKHPNAKTIYIIVDNARYYRSRLLKQYVKGTKIRHGSIQYVQG